MPRNDRKAGLSQSAGPSMPGDRPGYCQSCGRLLPDDTRSDPTPRKYCSNSCRSHAKSPLLKNIRHDLIQSFHQHLIDTERSSRRTVLCSQVEGDVFPSAQPRSGTTENDRPAQNDGSSGSKRRLDYAEEREEARRAARRLVAFGFRSQGVPDEGREVEAVQDGKVVETSFAKGEWGLRWK